MTFETAKQLSIKEYLPNPLFFSTNRVVIMGKIYGMTLEKGRVVLS